MGADRSPPWSPTGGLSCSSTHRAPSWGIFLMEDKETVEMVSPCLSTGPPPQKPPTDCVWGRGAPGEPQVAGGCGCVRKTAWQRGTRCWVFKAGGSGCSKVDGVDGALAAVLGRALPDSSLQPLPVPASLCWPSPRLSLCHEPRGKESAGGHSF